MSESGVRKAFERDGGGVTATYEDQATGRRRVEVFPGVGQRLLHRGWSGGQVGAAEAAADFCRELGSDWRVLSLSTPGSIYSDLQVRQQSGVVGADICPEANMVGVKNLDVLHPSLIGSSDTADRRRRGEALPG